MARKKKKLSKNKEESRYDENLLKYGSELPILSDGAAQQGYITDAVTFAVRQQKTSYDHRMCASMHWYLSVR